MPGGGPPEGALGVGGGGDGVRLQGALQPFGGRAVPALGFGIQRDQRESAAGVGLLGVIEAQLLGDREEASVVVAAGAGGVADTSRGGDAVDCLVEQSLEGELGATGGRGLSDQGLWGGEIGQLGVVPLNVGPRLRQLCGKYRWCRAHVVTTSPRAPVFLFRGIPNNLHVPVSRR